MGFQSMLIALTTALLALRNALRPRPSVNVTRNSEPHWPKGLRVENGDVGWAYCFERALQLTQQNGGFRIHQR